MCVCERERERERVCVCVCLKYMSMYTAMGLRFGINGFPTIVQ